MGYSATGVPSRAPRFNLSTRVVLHLPEGNFKGHSINVSQSGMLATFDRALDVWLDGRLFALVGEDFLGINVRVARVDGRLAGLTFQVAGESDRIMIQKLLERADRTPI